MAKKADSRKEPVRCIDCRNARLMQWGDNPVIAECRARGNEREVARHHRCCDLFQESKTEKTIEHFKRK